jgi:hypothetical protein
MGSGLAYSKNRRTEVNHYNAQFGIRGENPKEYLPNTIMELHRYDNPLADIRIGLKRAPL